MTSDSAAKFRTSARLRSRARQSPTSTVFSPRSAAYRPASRPSTTASPERANSAAHPSQTTAAPVSSRAESSSTVMSWGPVRVALGTSFSADFSMPRAVRVVSTWAVPMAAAYGS